MQNKFLSRAEAAQYLTEQRGLKTARTTLQKWVTTGGGPSTAASENMPSTPSRTSTPGQTAS